MNNYNEEEIIAQLQDPKLQREAFGKVVRHYSEPLYWQIRRMVLSHDDTNDLLQNTFIKAWSNLEYFRGEARLSTWLYRIAINESLNFLNKQRAINQLSLDEAETTALAKLESDPYFDGDHTQLLSKSHTNLTGKATYRVQPEILRGNEIRRYVGDSRNQRRCPESLLPPCREKNRRIFKPKRLNLVPDYQSNKQRKEG